MASTGFVAPSELVGRHFAIVNGLTTLVAVLVPVFLIAGGAPGEAPTVASAIDALGAFGLSESVVLAVVVIAVGFVLHPFQFAVTQILEGYWGASRPALRAMIRSAKKHHRRRHVMIARYREHSTTSAALYAQLDAVGSRIVRLEDSVEVAEDDRLLQHLRRHEFRLFRELIPCTVEMQELARAIARYPQSEDQVMPTRLGNVLRRYERAAGAPYGLDAVVAASYLAQVADPVVRDFYDDARNTLDTAVRMVVVWSFVTAVSIVLLWPYGAWLLVPTGTALLAYAAYGGAVATADQFGEALMVLVALGRSDLYRALGVDMPTSSELERERNVDLSVQLAGGQASIRQGREQPA